MNPSHDICIRCAESGESCCQRARIFITAGDVDRITRIVGGEAFFERIAVPDRYFLQSADDPAWAAIRDEAGLVRVLRRRPGQGCHFLGDGGCRLPMETRPLICRLYPFDYNEIAIKGVYAPLCPPAERGNSALLLALLGMNRDRAEAWRRTLYAEMRKESRHF